MAGLHGPLPTLRPWPRGQTRTARGRRGSLLLRRIGLSPTTPGRSPGALPRPGDQNPYVASPVSCRSEVPCRPCHDRFSSTRLGISRLGLAERLPTTPAFSTRTSLITLWGKLRFCPEERWSCSARLWCAIRVVGAERSLDALS